MKLLLDENISYRNNKSIFPPFFKSVDILGAGVSDDKIFQYAKKNNMVIVTKDKRFALDVIVSGSMVVVITDNYQSILVNPSIDVNPKYSSPITYYLQEHDEIIIP